MTWLEHMDSPDDVDADWSVIEEDVQDVLDNEYDLEWLGNVKVTIVKDEWKLKIALKRLRKSCQGKPTSVLCLISGSCRRLGMSFYRFLMACYCE